MQSEVAEAVQANLVQDVGTTTPDRGSYVGAIDATGDGDFDTAVDTSKSLIFTSWLCDQTVDHNVAGNAETGGEGECIWSSYFGGPQSVIVQRGMIEPSLEG
ncbi:MAG: hypothetical protein KAJ70_05340, partial [Candidatus Omnitrophica bacterium]|nr:hypothetical protein [Candidatus Omnitrophota bacterium]